MPPGRSHTDDSYHASSADDTAQARLLVGCCGAYCGTCKAYGVNACRGCRTGYATGERDIGRAKCSMKVCCIGRMGTDHTCADCDEYISCTVLGDFYGKNGYKYRAYHRSSSYIRNRGYRSFLSHAAGWTAAYGTLPDDSSASSMSD